MPTEKESTLFRGYALDRQRKQISVLLLRLTERPRNPIKFNNTVVNQHNILLIKSEMSVLRPNEISFSSSDF
jgi:hypothetical protein